MRTTKWVLLAIGIILVAIQFLQPSRNKSVQPWATDISSVVQIPDSVQIILRKACYDCHSNNTNYPFYSYVQPVGWFLARDIKHGRNQLNFNEFGSYPARRQISKLDGITYNVKENSMPLKSYRLMHKEARLPENEKTLLINWAQLTLKNLSGEK
jgi:hypothetical protein